MGRIFNRGQREITEARKPSVGPPSAELVGRQGFVQGIPLGGATETNPGQSASDGTIDRSAFMEQLYQAYLACPHASACIDTIARTITAGGLQPTPNSDILVGAEQPDMPPEVAEIANLLAWVNPVDDIRQLMRCVITDLEIFGDSFTEVVWLMGKPVAMYTLDPQTMTVLSDPHGIVTGFHQQMKTGLKVDFEPHEVIHVKTDAPGSGLYGVSPTQKNILPITAWLFTAALLKEAMKRGDPLRAWVDWPLALPETEMKRFQQQYQVRNLGASNIGNLVETKGGAMLKELGVNQINNWLQTKIQARDEIYTGYGVPPSKVGVIEAGNLGAGTGTSQDRMFNVNTCGPIGELVLEKFTFALLYQAYGITDWHLQFGQVDWRDDQIIEQIADLRVRSGRWTTNKSRAVIGEPPVPGGDKAFIVDRQVMILYEDLDDYSKASVAATKAKTIPSGPDTTDAPAGVPAGGSPAATAAKTVESDEPMTYSPGMRGPDQESQILEAAWRIAYQERRAAAMADLSEES